MLSIAFGQSKYMVDNLAENVKRGMRAKVRMGIWPTLAPFGYRNDTIKKTVIPDPDTAPYVKKIFELYAAGQHTLDELAAQSNGMGLVLRRKHFIKIHASLIQRILINPFYYGLIRWNGEDHQGVHEPLIARDLFNRAQRILSQRNC